MEETENDGQQDPRKVKVAEKEPKSTEKQLDAETDANLNQKKSFVSSCYFVCRTRKFKN